MQIRKIILAGGSGFLGKAIIAGLGDSCGEIVVLTRGAAHSERNIRYLQWDGKTAGDWSKELDGSKDLVGDWVEKKCGNFNVKTNKCGGGA